MLVLPSSCTCDPTGYDARTCAVPCAELPEICSGGRCDCDDDDDMCPSGGTCGDRACYYP